MASTFTSARRKEPDGAAARGRALGDESVLSEQPALPGWLPFSDTRRGSPEIITASCTDRPVWQKWPSPGSQPVPFGRSGGTVEHGTDHARAPLLGHIHDDADDEEVDGRESTQTGTGSGSAAGREDLPI